MKATYTKLFSTFLAENPTFLSSTLSFSNADWATSLINAITEKWESYELCDTDFTTDGNGDSDFKQYFRDIFLKFKPYYVEMLTNYLKSYDYSTGNKKSSTTHGTNSGTASATDSATDTGYALPNKLGGAEYPSTKKTSTGTTGTNNSGTADSTVDTTYQDEFIQLKNAYMSQIRDLFYEYAERFAPCFLHIF